VKYDPHFTGQAGDFKKIDAWPDEVCKKLDLLPGRWYPQKTVKGGVVKW